MARVFNLQLEIAGSVPASAMSSTTFGKVYLIAECLLRDGGSEIE